MNNVTFLQICFIINPKYWVLLPYIRITKTCPFQFTFLFLIVSLVNPTIENAKIIDQTIKSIDNGTE